MSDKPPERRTVSIPPTDDLHGRLDELVSDSQYDTVSEYVRAAIRSTETIPEPEDSDS